MLTTEKQHIIQDAFRGATQRLKVLKSTVWWHARVQWPSLPLFGANFADWVGAAVVILMRSQAVSPCSSKVRKKK